MKILHVTDLHFQLGASDWVLKNQCNADIVCITGDFLDTRSDAATALSQQVEYYHAWFKRFDVPLFVCSGNHDFEYEQRGWLHMSQLATAHGDETIKIINDVTVGCVPYQGELEHFAHCQVLLYHVPPRGTSAAKQDGVDYGCSVLKANIKNKSLQATHILCGHVHKPQKTALKVNGYIVINPGAVHSGEQPSYAIINI